MMYVACVCVAQHNHVLDKSIFAKRFITPQALYYAERSIIASPISQNRVHTYTHHPSSGLLTIQHTRQK
jgi:hypothetical protein